MFNLFLILIVIVAVLLVLAIMVQNPKGGGLSSSFGGGGSQQIGGVKQTSDFLDKSTWILATLLLVLVLLSNVSLMSNQTSDSKILPDGTQTETPADNIPTIPSENEESQD